MNDQTEDYQVTINRLLAGARTALQATYRMRALLPSSPWFAYLGSLAGGILVDRTDDPESEIPADWTVICRVDNSRTDEQTMAAIGKALRVMPIFPR